MSMHTFSWVLVRKIVVCVFEELLINIVNIL
jgi:hypothetical protein